MFKSRTRQYAEEQARQAPINVEIADLETQVEESESRNLRLTKELMDETKLRAQSERQRDEARETVQKLTKDLEEAQKPAFIKPAKKVKKAAKKPAKKATKTKVEPPRTSARKRGNVK